jgi:aspartyl/asparaginyl beta-hydroxylase (cupin superfamily)
MLRYRRICSGDIFSLRTYLLITAASCGIYALWQDARHYRQRVWSGEDMFHDVYQFPALSRLQAEWTMIRDELLGLSKAHFTMWPEREIYRGDWDVFGLYQFGAKKPDNCALCPRSAALVETVPGMITAGFSAMAPGTHILPHVGYTSKVLRCHLCLVPSADSAIRVGVETHAWAPGEWLVFDDTVEHEAWNRGDSARVVLLMDIAKDPSARVEYPDHVKAYGRKRTVNWAGLEIQL